MAALDELPQPAKLPPFHLPIAEPERRRRRKYEFVPPACETWMAVADAEAELPEGQCALAGPVTSAGARQPQQPLPQPQARELPVAGWADDPALPAEYEGASEEAASGGFLGPRPPEVVLPAGLTVAKSHAVPVWDRAMALPAATAAEREVAPVPAGDPIETAERSLPALPQPAAMAVPDLPGGGWKEIPDARPAVGGGNPKTAAPSFASGLAAANGEAPNGASLRPDLPAPAPPLAAAAAWPPQPVASLTAFPPFTPAPAGFALEPHAVRLPVLNGLGREALPTGEVIAAEPLLPQGAAEPPAPLTRTEPEMQGAVPELPRAEHLPAIWAPGPAGRCAPPPQPVESLPTAGRPLPRPVASAVAVSLPEFATSGRPELAVAGFGSQPPRASAPEPRKLNSKAARLIPISSIAVQVPIHDTPPDDTRLPEGGFIPVDFYVGRAASTPARRVFWQPSQIPLVPPAFPLRVAAEDRVEQAPPPKPEPKASPAEVFTLPEVKRRVNQRTLSRFAKIAACLMVASCVWLGIQTVRMLAPPRSEDEALATNDTGRDGGAAVSAQAAQGSNAAPGDSAPPSDGVMASLRRAIAGRAATTTGDTLRNGMESWGTAPKGWAPGWARNPDGYTRPGELALFQPSLSYADYRLEFFGQIESRAMGWVVRAQDKQNYYAMKLTVVEGGLRPIIAMVHYPVVGGVKGHAVETPLSVMVHRNTPFRVDVDVRGNRLTASVEGQRVESWRDDLLAKGGVGFFSEPGERARLYWMKVLRNQDMLGSICSFLSGGTNDTASLRRPDWPADSPRRPASEPVEAAVLEPETGSSPAGAAGGRNQNQGRIRRWS